MKINRTTEPLAPVIPIGIKYTEFKCGNCKQTIIVPEPSPIDLLQGNRESGAFNLMHQHVKDCKND
jgi:hypothetical protein